MKINDIIQYIINNATDDEIKVIKKAMKEKSRKEHVKQFYTDELKGYFAYDTYDNMICFSSLENWKQNQCVSDSLDENIYTAISKTIGIGFEGLEACFYYDESLKKEMEEELNKCGLFYKEELQTFLNKLS